MARTYPFSSFKSWVDAVSKKCGASASQAQTFLLELETMLDYLNRTISTVNTTQVTVTGSEIVRITATGVDLLGSGTLILYNPVGNFVVTDATIWGTTVSGITTPPTIGFGTTPASNNVFKGAQLLGATGNNLLWRFASTSGGRQQGVISGYSLRMNKTGGVGSAFLANIAIQGFYLN